MSGFVRQESKLIYAPKICHNWQVFGASFCPDIFNILP